jgi:hypothetical protein
MDGIAFLFFLITAIWIAYVTVIKATEKSMRAANRKRALLLALVLVPSIIGVTLILVSLEHGVYCHVMGPSYYEGDICFSIDYRCGIECGVHGREYQNKTEGCLCDCGDTFVSLCTGFPHEKGGGG